MSESSPTAVSESSPESNVSAEMAAAVGREMSRKVSYPVSDSDIRRWALAVYYPDSPPQRFLTAAAAAESSFDGIVAPEEFNPFAWLAAESVDATTVAIDGNDPDRTEKSLGMTGPGLKFQLNGGLDVDYGVPIRPGDVITSVSRLAGYRERAGRLGLMLITSFEDTWTNQDDQHVKTSRTTLIRY